MHIRGVPDTPPLVAALHAYHPAAASLLLRHCYSGYISVAAAAPYYTPGPARGGNTGGAQCWPAPTLSSKAVPGMQGAPHPTSYILHGHARTPHPYTRYHIQYHPCRNSWPSFYCTWLYSVAAYHVHAAIDTARAHITYPASRCCDCHDCDGCDEDAALPPCSLNHKSGGPYGSWQAEWVCSS